MTSKEKAIDLIDKFNVTGIMHAKRAALITVEEVQHTIENMFMRDDNIKDAQLHYWKSVAVEIKIYNNN